MSNLDSTRRQFLGALGVGAAAATLSAANLSAGTRELKLCMIGDRGHNGYILDAIEEMPHVHVVGVSPSGDDLKKLLGKLGKLGHEPQNFSDYEKMMDELKPDIVSVCGPFELHAKMSASALERGIPVFCEKPVAITMEDLETLKTVQDRSGAHFAGMMGMRYMPAFHTAHKIVESGGIGEVRLINVQKSYRLGTNRGDYYHKRETLGGLIPLNGSHAVDLVHWFSEKKFKSVYAVHSRMHNSGHGDLEVSAHCEFVLENEIFASVNVDYLRPATAPSHGDDRIRVAGTEGVVEVRHGEVFLINKDTDGEEKIESNCDTNLFRDFVEHVEGKTKSELGAEDTFAVTRALLLARQSADEEKLVYF